MCVAVQINDWYSLRLVTIKVEKAGLSFMKFLDVASTCSLWVEEGKETGNDCPYRSNWKRHHRWAAIQNLFFLLELICSGSVTVPKSSGSYVDTILIFCTQQMRHVKK